MALELAVTYHPGCTVVGVIGTLDAISTPGAKERLDELLAQGHNRMIIDVARLGFCDSSGIWLLLGLHRKTIETGGWIRLAGVNGFLLRLLALTHLDAAFTIDEDLTASLIAASAASGPGRDAGGEA
ncbi:STAS domain-containing protein [Sphaerisporangium flaviroseum]|uniref:STAS domain-containing protein n=1 Tax=Sphaerisporangium flaviroseum TaxID=509199 RepID=A0ABP7I2R1_9ACTN